MNLTGIKDFNLFRGKTDTNYDKKKKNGNYYKKKIHKYGFRTDINERTKVNNLGFNLIIPDADY
jgi:hypothetical protein